MTKLIPPAHQVFHSGATVRVYHASKGEGLPKHDHTYAHLTMCHAGSCVIRKEGIEKVIDKNTQPINLKANEWHEIEALENGTVFLNIFAEGKY
jgi:quercetin dioxygenase-like cupin family protein